MFISLFIKQHGLAGLRLFRNLAFRQITCKEPRQNVDEYWRNVLQVFWSYSVGTGCRHDSMSYFGRKNLWNEMSVYRLMVKRQVDMALEEIRVEVADDFTIRLLDAMVVPFEFRDERESLNTFTTARRRLRVFGREFLVPCESCCSALAYQLKSFKRQAPLGGFKTLTNISTAACS
ncbi:hypothetical protein RB195_017331 [Necator americanus]|uniref:Uncharacterized protein n=1 Tax=Necator americanus TaxID=51031 RepID=A0ABR1C8C8_NECAM